MKTFNKKELAWINRLQKTLNAMPKTLQVFDNENNISVYKGELPINNLGSVDSFIEHETVILPRGQWERGGW